MIGAKRSPAMRDGILVDGVTKRYGMVAAIKELTFAVVPGEALALWGPNGAGKTTILRCLLGLARYEGTIRVAGHDPLRAGREMRRSVGYVPQDLPVAPVTVGEQVAFVSQLKKAPREDALAQLKRLGIGDQIDKSVGALSGGMKQRLALALALIGTPSVLLLDEPTASLDARGQAELLDLLATLKRGGMTIVISSHRPDDVLAVADRVLMIEGGVLQQHATPAAFAQEIGAAARLIVTLSNGHLPVAIATLSDLGYEATGEGHVLTVPIGHRDKVRVIGALVRNGIEIDDFDVERG